MDDENLGMLYFCLLKNDIAVGCHRCRSVVSPHLSPVLDPNNCDTSSQRLYTPQPHEKTIRSDEECPRI